MDIQNRVIGILGTSKNTGKTTTTNFMLEWANRKGITVALTSIGYDGEDIDNITGLPKPRIFAEAGNIIATAQQCFSASQAKVEIIEKTPIQTSLGQVLIGKVLEEGLIVLAGPNKGKDLFYILQKIKQHSVRFTLVDGALNRIIPLIYCDALILATGASRHTDIPLLVKETKGIISLYQLPVRKQQRISNQSIQTEQKSITIFQKDGTNISLPSHSLMSKKTVDQIIENIHPDTKEIYIPGIIHNRILEDMIQKYALQLRGQTFLINNPAFLLVGSQEVSHLNQLILKIQEKGISLYTLHHLPILAVTINPFYPKYNRFGKEDYKAAWVDRQELYQQMSRNLDLPVIDIKEKKGNKKLIQVMEEFLDIHRE